MALTGFINCKGLRKKKSWLFNKPEADRIVNELVDKYGSAKAQDMIRTVKKEKYRAFLQQAFDEKHAKIGSRTFGRSQTLQGVYDGDLSLSSSAIHGKMTYSAAEAAKLNLTHVRSVCDQACVLCGIPIPPNDSQVGVTNTNKYVYQGLWQNNKRHGKGFCHFPNGDFYNGLWENDLKHGQGTYRCCNGIEYSGHFHRDVCHGRCRIQIHDAIIFDGEYNSLTQEFTSVQSTDQWEPDFSTNRVRTFSVAEAVGKYEHIISTYNLDAAVVAAAANESNTAAQEELRKQIETGVIQKQQLEYEQYERQLWREYYEALGVDPDYVEDEEKSDENAEKTQVELLDDNIAALEQFIEHMKKELEDANQRNMDVTNLDIQAVVKQIERERQTADNYIAQSAGGMFQMMREVLTEVNNVDDKFGVYFHGGSRKVAEFETQLISSTEEFHETLKNFRGDSFDVSLESVRQLAEETIARWKETEEERVAAQKEIESQLETAQSMLTELKELRAC